MKPVNITSYVQRPVDSFKEPVRSPITEWEYDELHAGERPRTGNTSSSSSELYEFSIGSEEESDKENKDDLMSLCHPPSYNEPDLMKLDPNQVGRALQNDLDFVASSHFENEEKIQRQKETTKAVMSSFKYSYFDDDISDQEDHLPKIKRKKSPNNSSSRNIYSGSSKRQSSNLNVSSKIGSSTGKSVTDMLKSSISAFGVPDKTDIERRTSQLREKKTPKNSTDIELDFSNDSDIDILKSSCSTIKNSKQPFKKETCETTSQLREERKPKQKEFPSDNEYYLDKNDKNKSNMNTLDADEFQISDESDLEESIRREDFTDDFLKSDTNKSSKSLSFNPNINTSELLKPIDSFETADITREQYDQLNKSMKSNKNLSSANNQEEEPKNHSISMMKVTVVSSKSNTLNDGKQSTINSINTDQLNKSKNKSQSTLNSINTDQLNESKNKSLSTINSINIDQLNESKNKSLSTINSINTDQLNESKSQSISINDSSTFKKSNEKQNLIDTNNDNETTKSINKSVINESKNQSNLNESKYESNPPSMFTKYIEENPPPPKPKIDIPDRFKYEAKPLENNPPSMYKNNPPKPPNKVKFNESTRIEHDYLNIPDNPPSFLTDTDRNKKKRKPVSFYQDPLKEFELDDEEKVIAEHKRKKMIEERVNGPSNMPQQNDNRKYTKGQINKEKVTSKSERSEKADLRRYSDQKRKTSPQRTQQMKEKKEREKKMFYEPAETQASRLRNQRIKQKLAIKHEQERILDEAENDRIRRQQQVALQLEPELLRLEQISKDRQGKKRKIQGRSNDSKALESIHNALENVKNTEVLLRRSDRSLILQDVNNKRIKERREKEKMDEYRMLEKRKTANEKIMKMWS